MKRSFLLFLLFLISCRHRPADLQPKTGKQVRPEIAIPPLSGGCAEADFAKFGRPIMMELRKGVFMGVSVPSEHSAQFYPVPLYFWVENRSDEVQSFSSCVDTDWFRMYGFHVYDAQGHRLPSIEEKANRQSRRAVCGFEMVCESTATTLLLPHTCHALDRSASRNLLDIYSLPPGQYTLRLADLAGCTVDPKTGEPKPSLTTESEGPAPALKITIDAQ